MSLTKIWSNAKTARILLTNFTLSHSWLRRTWEFDFWIETTSLIEKHAIDDSFSKCCTGSNASEIAPDRNPSCQMQKKMHWLDYTLTMSSGSCIAWTRSHWAGLSNLRPNCNCGWQHIVWTIMNDQTWTGLRLWKKWRGGQYHRNKMTWCASRFPEGGHELEQANAFSI